LLASKKPGKEPFKPWKVVDEPPKPVKKGDKSVTSKSGRNL